MCVFCYHKNGLHLRFSIRVQCVLAAIFLHSKNLPEIPGTAIGVILYCCAANLESVFYSMVTQRLAASSKAARLPFATG